MNTCDTCKHYKESLTRNPNKGACYLHEVEGDLKCDGIQARSEFGHDLWINVGPKFGCIHWMAKEPE